MPAASSFTRVQPWTATGGAVCAQPSSPPDDEELLEPELPVEADPLELPPVVEVLVLDELAPLEVLLLDAVEELVELELRVPVEADVVPVELAVDDELPELAAPLVPDDAAELAPDDVELAALDALLTPEELDAPAPAEVPAGCGQRAGSWPGETQ